MLSLKSGRTLNLGADHARTRSMLRIMRGMLLFLRRILRFGTARRPRGYSTTTRRTVSV